MHDLLRVAVAQNSMKEGVVGDAKEGHFTWQLLMAK